MNGIKTRYQWETSKSAVDGPHLKLPDSADTFVEIFVLLCSGTVLEDARNISHSLDSRSLQTKKTTERQGGEDKFSLWLC